MINLCIWCGKGWMRRKGLRKGGSCFAVRKYKNYAWILVISLIYHLEDVILHQHEYLFTVFFSEAWLSWNRLLRLRKYFGNWNRTSARKGPVRGTDRGSCNMVMKKQPCWCPTTGASEYSEYSLAGGAEGAILGTVLSECHWHKSFSSSRPNGLTYQALLVQAVPGRSAQP